MLHVVSDVSCYQLASRDCRNRMLYNLHPGLLGHRGDLFASLFSLPRRPDFPGVILSEGRFEGSPIELPYTISQQDFDHLLTYLYEGPRYVSRYL